MASSTETSVSSIEQRLSLYPVVVSHSRTSADSRADVTKHNLGVPCISKPLVTSYFMRQSLEEKPFLVSPAGDSQKDQKVLKNGLSVTLESLLSFVRVT